MAQLHFSLDSSFTFKFDREIGEFIPILLIFVHYLLIWDVIVDEIVWESVASQKTNSP